MLWFCHTAAADINIWNIRTRCISLNDSLMANDCTCVFLRPSRRETHTMHPMTKKTAHILIVKCASIPGENLDLWFDLWFMHEFMLHYYMLTLCLTVNGEWINGEISWITCLGHISPKIKRKREMYCFIYIYILYITVYINNNI